MSPLTWHLDPEPPNSSHLAYLGWRHVFTLAEQPQAAVQLVELDGRTPAGPVTYSSPFRLTNRLGLGDCSADTVEEGMRRARDLLDLFLAETCCAPVDTPPLPLKTAEQVLAAVAARYGNEPALMDEGFDGRQWTIVAHWPDEWAYHAASQITSVPGVYLEPVNYYQLAVYASRGDADA